MAAGFTWLDGDGNFIQVSWASLNEKDERLYVHDGTRWKRLRKVDQAVRYGSHVRVAIAGKDADEGTLESESKMVPASMLTGRGSEKVARLRKLGALSPTVVTMSRMWDSLDDESQKAVKNLWEKRSHEVISDISLLDRRPTSRGPSPEVAFLRSSLLKAGFAGGIGAGKEDLIGALALPPNVSRLDFTRFLLSSGIHDDPPLSYYSHGYQFQWDPSRLDSYAPQDATSVNSEAAYIARFAESDDPLRDALNHRYEMHSTDKEEALAASALISSCALTAAEALVLVREHGLAGAAGDKLALMAAGIARHGGAGAGEIIVDVKELFDADPRAAEEKYGTVKMVLARMFPAFSIDERRLLLSQLHLAPSLPYEGRAKTIIEETNLGNLQNILSLMEAPGHGAAPTQNLELALRAVATFGDKASDWLKNTATSPALDAVRSRDLLPKMPEVSGRINALTRSLEKPPPSDEEVLSSARLAGFYEGLLNAGEKSSLTAVMRSLTDADLRAVLPNSKEMSNRVKNVADRLKSGDITGEERERLEPIQAWLEKYSRALKQVANDPSFQDELDRLLSQARDDENLLSFLAPDVGNPRELKNIQKKRNDHVSVVAGAGQKFLTAASESEHALWGTNFFGDAIDKGDVVPQDLEMKRAAQRKELEHLNAYRDALTENDEESIASIGRILRGGEPDERARVSIHDALFWLPTNVSSATAADGTRFGDWLLADNRGAGAMEGEQGRISLQLVADSWALFGGKNANMRDIVKARMSMDYGGHTDPASSFFAASKVAASNADISLVHLHYSQNIPSVLPVGKVFTPREESGDAPASGYRGYFLGRDDPRGMQLGLLTDCCQHTGSAGRSCAEAGQSHPASGFFVVEDAAGTVIAQSWVWAAKDGSDPQGASTGVIFDNIEARLGGSHERTRMVRSIYDSAAAELSTRFDRVLVGSHGNDVSVQDLPITNHNLSQADIGYHAYVGDSATQRVWHDRRSAHDTRVSVNPKGFTVNRVDGDGVESSFSYTAASIPAELRSLRRTIDARSREAGIPAGVNTMDAIYDLLEKDPSVFPVVRRLRALESMMQSSPGWGMGLFEDGEDCNLVEIRGPAGRALAIEELSKTGFGTYKFRDKSGNEELVEIEQQKSEHGMHADYQTLPANYRDMSKLVDSLRTAGMSEKEAIEYMEFFPGDMGSAHKAWSNGWPASAAYVAAYGDANPAAGRNAPARLSEMLWLGLLPCPQAITDIENKEAREKAAYQYAKIASSSREPHAAAAALASPKVRERVDFISALSDVARASDERLVARFAATPGLGKWADVPAADRWESLSSELKESAKSIELTPAHQALVQKGIAALGLHEPSPWTGADETLTAAMQLAAERMLNPSSGEVAARSGVSAFPIHDSALAARDRVPVELLLTREMTQVDPSARWPVGNIAWPSANHQRLAFSAELATRGLSPEETALLVSTAVSSTCTSRDFSLAASSDALVEYTKEIRLAHREVQKGLHRELKRTDIGRALHMPSTYVPSGDDVVRLSSLSEPEYDDALKVDKHSAARGREFLEKQLRDAPRYDESPEAYEAHQTKVAQERADYRKIMHHVLVPASVPLSVAESLVDEVNRAREVCEAAGEDPQGGHNMPDYYFSDIEDMLAVASYTGSMDDFRDKINPNALSTRNSIEVAAPLLNELVPLLPPLDEEAADRKDQFSVTEIARAHLSGCTAADIADIARIAPVATSYSADVAAGTDKSGEQDDHSDDWTPEKSARRLRRALQVSATLRAARAKGVDRVALETVAGIVSERSMSSMADYPLDAGGEAEVAWWLDFVANHPEAIESIREKFDEISIIEDRSPDRSDNFWYRRSVRGLVAEFGGMPDSLGGPGAAFAETVSPSRM